MAAKAKVILFSVKVKDTCWSSTAKRVGLRFNLHKHQMLGKRLSLWFMAKSFKFKFTNHLLGKSSKFIHGSDKKTKSGL
jgi:hypothetical protein